MRVLQHKLTGPYFCPLIPCKPTRLNGRFNDYNISMSIASPSLPAFPLTSPSEWRGLSLSSSPSPALLFSVASSS